MKICESISTFCRQTCNSARILVLLVTGLMIMTVYSPCHSSVLQLCASQDSIPVSTAPAPTVQTGNKKVTPVITDDNAPQQPVLHFYDKHGEALKEPVYFLAELDTVQKAKPKAIYPLLNSMSIGFNFADAIMLIAGQRHTDLNFSADLSLFNWIIPVVEAGIGFAKSNPEDGNFIYKTKPSFFGKIGFNYNFLYKSSPDYQAFVGFRAGFSAFSYDITDITLSAPYWHESLTTSILNQKATAFYGEVLAGLRVKIWKPIHLGWTFGYNFKMHTSQPSNSTPWYIPGYGTNSPIHVTFSIFYSIPLSKTTTDLPTPVN